MIKRFLILALLICLATGIVSAVSSGDDVGHAQLFENKYYDNNPAIRDVLPPTSYGWAIFRARGVSVQDPYIFVDRDPSAKPVDLSFHYDQTMTDGQNSHMLLVKLMPNGESEPIMFQAGCWNAYMRRSNADQPEKQRFCTGTGATEYVTFLGAAIPTIHKEICKVFTVIDVPGYIIHHEEVNHTVHHEATTSEIVVVDEPAWTEYIYHQEVNYTVHHDAITHEEFVVDGYYYVHDTKWFLEVWHWVEKVKCSNHAEHGNGWHVQTSACTEAYGHNETIIDSEAWDEIVVDEPAYTETVEHPEVSHIEIIVVTEPWDEIVVDTPAYDEQVGAITHEETVCNKYGEPVPPPNSTTLF